MCSDAKYRSLKKKEEKTFPTQLRCEQANLPSFMALFTSHEKEPSSRAPTTLIQNLPVAIFPSPLPMSPRAPQQNPIFSPFLTDP